MRVWAASALTWRGNWLCEKRRRLIEIVPDAKYPGMWRVRQAGQLSDMVNKTRAKDAAVGWALQILNREETAPDRVPVAPAPSLGSGT